MSTTNDQVTVKELLEACQREVDLGNGDKTIWLSVDEEGNGFHPCFFLFTDPFEFSDPEDLGITEEDFANSLILG